MAFFQQNPFGQFNETIPEDEFGIRGVMAAGEQALQQADAIDSALSEMLKFQANDKVPEMEVPDIPSPVNVFSFLGASLKGEDAIAKLGQKAERHQRLMTQAQLTADAERLRQEGYLQRRQQQVAESISRLKAQKEGIQADLNAKIKLAEIAGDEKERSRLERAAALKDKQDLEILKADREFLNSDGHIALQTMMEELRSGNKMAFDSKTRTFVPIGEDNEITDKPIKYDPTEIKSIETRVLRTLMQLDTDSPLRADFMRDLEMFEEVRAEAFKQAVEDRKTEIERVFGQKVDKPEDFDEAVSRNHLGISALGFGEGGLNALSPSQDVLAGQPSFRGAVSGVGAREDPLQPSDKTLFGQPDFPGADDALANTVDDFTALSDFLSTDIEPNTEFNPLSPGTGFIDIPTTGTTTRSERFARDRAEELQLDALEKLGRLDSDLADSLRAKASKRLASSLIAAGAVEETKR